MCFSCSFVLFTAILRLIHTIRGRPTSTETFVGFSRFLVGLSGVCQVAECLVIVGIGQHLLVQYELAFIQMDVLVFFANSCGKVHSKLLSNTNCTKQMKDKTAQMSYKCTTFFVSQSWSGAMILRRQTYICFSYHAKKHIPVSSTTCWLLELLWRRCLIYKY